MEVGVALLCERREPSTIMRRVLGAAEVDAEAIIMAVDEEDEDDGGPSLLPRRRQLQQIRA